MEFVFQVQCAWSGGCCIQLPISFIFGQVRNNQITVFNKQKLRKKTRYFIHIDLGEAGGIGCLVMSLIILYIFFIERGLREIGIIRVKRIR